MNPHVYGAQPSEKVSNAPCGSVAWKIQIKMPVTDVRINGQSTDAVVWLEVEPISAHSWVEARAAAMLAHGREAADVLVTLADAKESGE